MRLILHIGSPKTGTTTLQHALSNSRQKLLQRGILYPKVGEYPNHNILSLFFRNDPPVREYARLYGGDPMKLAKEGRSTLDLVMKQCEREKVDTVLLSAEYLFYPLNSEAGHDFASGLSSYFDEIETVCYLRHPIDYFSSVAAQRFKAATFIDAPRSSPYLSILRSYRRFSDLVVRDFSRLSLINGDILTDFSEKFLGLENFELSGARRNEGVSAEGLLILSQYRGLEFPNDENRFTPKSRKLLAIIQNAERNAKLQAKVALRSDLAEYLWLDFLPFRNDLQEEFFLDFNFSKSRDSSLYSPPPRLSVSDVFEIDDVRLQELSASVIRELMNHVGPNPTPGNVRG